MKLPMLPEVLFDEFPTDQTVKYCIFTRPKFPDLDYSNYVGKVTFCCTETTLFVMTSLRKLPIQLFHLLSERKTKFKCKTPFSVRCISTGSISESVMVLIEVEEAIHLYTGQFTQCRDVLLSPITLFYRNRISDIHVDNTMVGLRVPGILVSACNQIKQIVSEYTNYTIYLHMELFGYEDLLFELASSGIKIQLNILQTILFKKCNLSNLFEFDGNPQLKVYARFREERPLKREEYEMLFKTKKIIHIKLIMAQHEFRNLEKINGLKIVSYTPHADAHILHDLFETLKPQRVHPLEAQHYIYDSMSVISNDLLNDGCEIVEHGFDESNVQDGNRADSVGHLDESGNTFLQLSDVNSFEVSADISDIDINFDSQSDTSRISEPLTAVNNKKTPTEKPSTGETSVVDKSPNARNQTKTDNAIISLDEEDEGDLDEILAMAVEPNISPSRNPTENQPMNQLNVKETNRNVSKQPDCIPPSPQSNTQKNADTAHSTAMNISNQNNKITPNAISMAGVKRKPARSIVNTQKFYRMQRVEYVSDSENDSQNEVEAQVQAQIQIATEVQNKAKNNDENVNCDQNEDLPESNDEISINSDSSSNSDCCLVFPD